MNQNRNNRQRPGAKLTACKKSPTLASRGFFVFNQWLGGIRTSQDSHRIRGPLLPALVLRMAGFKGAGPLGGDVGGIPLVTSSTVPDTLIALIDAAGILVAGDGVVLDVSDQALLATENGETFNLYLIGIKATRILKWKVAREGWVAYISDIAWRR